MLSDFSSFILAVFSHWEGLVIGGAFLFVDWWKWVRELKSVPHGILRTCAIVSLLISAFLAWHDQMEKYDSSDQAKIDWEQRAEYRQKRID